jgi:hypothetical protein
MVPKIPKSKETGFWARFPVLHTFLASPYKWPMSSSASSLR